MKKHLSSVLFGCLGLGVGFTLCYVYCVLPERAAGSSRQAQFVTPRFVALPGHQAGELNWRPYLIQPMIPPKVVGK